MNIGAITYMLLQQQKAKEAEQQRAQEEAEEETRRMEQEILRFQIEQSGFREGIDGVGGLSWEALGFPERLCH